MADDDIHLIGPDEEAYRLSLTPAQLKIPYSALRSMLADFGHDEPDVHRTDPDDVGEDEPEHRPGERGEGGGEAPEAPSGREVRRGVHEDQHADLVQPASADGDFPREFFGNFGNEAKAAFSKVGVLMASARRTALAT